MQTTKPSALPSVVVYGPMGCGKTRNARRIAKALNLSTIVDDWHLGSGRAWPRSGALLLTNTPPPEWFRYSVVSYDDAMKQVAA